MTRPPTTIAMHPRPAAVLAIAVALVIAVSGSACAPKHAAAVRGTWELRGPDGRPYPGGGTFADGGVPRWFIFRPGGTTSAAEMTWPYGLGCQDEVGTFRESTMDFSRSRFQVVVTFHSSRRATLSYPAVPGRKWKLHRINRVTGVGCE